MMRNRAIPLTIIALLLVSACSAKQDDKTSNRNEEDVLCADFGIDRKGYTDIENGFPKVEDVLALRRSEHCKLEIVAMYDFYPDDYPESMKPHKPDIVGAPQEITNGMSVRWIKIEDERPTEDRWLVVPAYTFECSIDKAKDPDFVCEGKAATGHKLSTYADTAYDISLDAAVSEGPVSLKFNGGVGGGQKDTSVQEYATTAKFEANSVNQSVWTLLLVLKKKWERTGIAMVCLGAATTDNCHTVRARATHEEDYIITRDTLRWESAVQRFRAKMRRPAYKFASEPTLPARVKHRDYEGGPLIQSLDVGVVGLIVNWRNTDSTLQRKELKGSIQLGLKGGLSNGTGSERTTDSSAELSYAPNPKMVAPSLRCFEVLSVGGELLDAPVTGMVLKEGCE